MRQVELGLHVYIESDFVLTCPHPESQRGIDLPGPPAVHGSNRPEAVESTWVNASFLESTMKEVEEKTIDGIKVLLKMDGGAFCI